MILPKYECPLHFIATAVPGSGMQGLKTEEDTESPGKFSRTGQTKAECKKDQSTHPSSHKNQKYNKPHETVSCRLLLLQFWGGEARPQREMIFGSRQ